MTNELVLHPYTSQQLDNFVRTPSHAVVLIGPAGSGKHGLAMHVSSQLLGVADASQHPYIKIIRPIDGKAIGVDSIRALEQFVSLQVPGTASVRRIVIIEEADLLTIESQNALLKTLEEPPTDTVMILTASQEQSLLPTIRSRTTAINVKRPVPDTLREYFANQGHPSAEIKQAINISGGLPGLLHALLNDLDHPLVPATEQARNLLNGTSYERLLVVDALSKDKPLAQNTLYILQQMAHLSLQSATDKTSSRWAKVLEASYNASQALANSGQTKLVLTNLMLNLG